MCTALPLNYFSAWKRKTTDELESDTVWERNGLYIKNQFQNAFRSWWFDVRSLEPEQKTIRINRTNGLGVVKCAHNLYLFKQRKLCVRRVWCGALYVAPFILHALKNAWIYWISHCHCLFMFSPHTMYIHTRFYSIFSVYSLNAEHLQHMLLLPRTYMLMLDARVVHALSGTEKREWERRERKKTQRGGCANSEPRARASNEQWIAENFIPKINKTLFLFCVGRFFETVTVIESTLWLNDYESRLFICFGFTCCCCHY